MVKYSKIIIEYALAIGLIIMNSISCANIYWKIIWVLGPKKRNASIVVP